MLAAFQERRAAPESYHAATALFLFPHFQNERGTCYVLILVLSGPRPRSLVN